MYAQWASENLRIQPGAEVLASVLRADYVGWVSDHPGMRRDPVDGLRAAVGAVGPGVAYRGGRFFNVALVYPEDALVVADALWVLAGAGLISEAQARRVCAARLGL